MEQLLHDSLFSSNIKKANHVNFEGKSSEVLELKREMS
jgi:hypothetical protein